VPEGPRPAFGIIRERLNERGSRQSLYRLPGRVPITSSSWSPTRYGRQSGCPSQPTQYERQRQFLCVSCFEKRLELELTRMISASGLTRKRSLRSG
jgi:hypothetical protein